MGGLFVLFEVHCEADVVKAHHVASQLSLSWVSQANVLELFLKDHSRHAPVTADAHDLHLELEQLLEGVNEL